MPFRDRTAGLLVDPAGRLCTFPPQEMIAMLPRDGSPSQHNRRKILAAAFGGLAAAEVARSRADAQAEDRPVREAPIQPKDPIRITKLETILVKPRWLFLKIHTNAGIVGLGEPIV